MIKENGKNKEGEGTCVIESDKSTNWQLISEIHRPQNYLGKFFYNETFQTQVFSIHSNNGSVHVSDTSLPKAQLPQIGSSSSSETISIQNINPKFQLPSLVPREHGSKCVLEISVLEKHKMDCPNKKFGDDYNRNLDDNVGSYDVINRVVYNTCNPVVKNYGMLSKSTKGFKLNDPNYFGIDLKENRSRIDGFPILSESLDVNVVRFSTPVNTLDLRKSSDTISIYLRYDKNEEVPTGFQKVHYPGDSCNVQIPSEKSKRLLSIKKVIEETASASFVSKSSKTFSPLSSNNAISIIEDPSMALQTTLFPSHDINSSNESLDAVAKKNVLFSLTKEQDTDVASERNESCKQKIKPVANEYQIPKGELTKFIEGLSSATNITTIDRTIGNSSMPDEKVRILTGLSWDNSNNMPENIYA
ncbi:hypothetical protein FQA39_LY04725 [Lamprigera yunnana]|nr:hypothetical protein FQA39_LY04725 [Lamprigera yunnana]